MGFPSFFVRPEVKTDEIPNLKEDVNLRKAFVNLNVKDVNIFQFSDPRPVNDLLHRESYTVAYDRRFRIPYWSAEVLTKESFQGIANRKLSQFLADKDLPEEFRSRLEDYRVNKLYDRGHLAPASGAKFSQKAMDETHLLSNIAPQVPMFNQRFWRKPETLAKNLTKDYDHVIVYTGLLFMQTEEKDGRSFCKFEILNDNTIVPTHWYKAIYAVKKNQPPHVGVFIMPNQVIDMKLPLTNFQKDLKHLEEKAGLDFTSRLPKNFSNLCSKIDCNKQSM